MEDWMISTLIWEIPILVFFLTVMWRITLHPEMFTKAYGRRHRIFGGILLVWLIVGYLQLGLSSEVIQPFVYDVALGVIATTATLTAAFDFQKAHSHVKNVASGTLEKEATVTYDEMIEHSFYQILNLLQILFIHSLIFIDSYPLHTRLLFAFIASSFWFLRSFYPVNKFSDNYTKGQNVFSLISVLYRTKKYQYIFYKHFLLHGLIISLAAHGQSGESIHVTSTSKDLFRLYWLSLNTSYVMEFFLQTLVKKGYMSQSTLIFLQLLLMSVSSVVAVEILMKYCDLRLGFLSLVLNFTNRKREMTNVALVIGAAYFLYR
jgi:hypothetical protein